MGCGKAGIFSLVQGARIGVSTSVVFEVKEVG